MSIKDQLHACLQDLREGRLTEERLRAVLDAVSESGPARRQDLLYLQSRGSSPQSQIIGIARYARGERMPPPVDPDQWPYQTVAEAIADGWRIISFPNSALMMDDQNTYGLGCEFILEKWS